MHYEILTETQIEKRVESAIDRLDLLLMHNQLIQEEYDREIVSIDKWASQQYDHLKNAKGMLWSVTW